MSQQNVELVRAMFQGFSRKAWESGEWMAGWDPGLVYHPREDEPDTGPCVDREGWAEILGGFMDAFAEITFDV